ncbi:MAG: GIY-YIG nuclease family protein [Candidatus Sulfotelmatobacter sp.]
MFSSHRHSQPDRGKKDQCGPPKQFFVYIMTNNPLSAVLYVGITGNLTHRVWQHKNKLTPGFTAATT